MTRKTLPGTNWRVFWQSITLLSSASKTPGKATGSVSDWTDVRSLARRKSKWSMGGCGALRRCGCARTYEGTQFLCVKFRLGSAGEPTICIHCYDVLNEDLSFHVDRPSHSWDKAISKFETGNSRSRSELKVTTWVQHSVDSQPFFFMSIGHPISELRLFQNLTLNIKGQGHGWGHSSKSQCGSNILSTHIPFVPCQSAFPF